MEEEQKKVVKKDKEPIEKGLENVSGGTLPLSVTKWQCKKCKTLNNVYYSKCTKCGEPQ